MHHPPDNPFSKFSGQIDQVLMSPRITEQETIDGCGIALGLELSNVWVKPCYLHQTINLFRKSPLNIGTFIGYPFGVSTTHVKLAETKRALSEGANMLALSLNVGDIIAENTKAILEEIRCVCGLARMNGASCKILLDSSLLDISQVFLSAEAAINGDTDGAIFQVEAEKDQQYNPFSDILQNLGRNNLSASLFFPDPVSIEDVENVLKAGFNRVGMRINA